MLVLTVNSLWRPAEPVERSVDMLFLSAPDLSSPQSVQGLDVRDPDVKFSL